MGDMGGYLPVIIDIFNNAKKWLYALIGVATIVAIIIQAFRYQSGDAGEKSEAMKLIRNTAIMGAGVYILVWLAGYVMTRMAGV